MNKFVIAILLLAVVKGCIPCRNPICQDIVEEIRKATDIWKPLDPKKNPLAKLKPEQMKVLLGVKGLPGEDEEDNSKVSSSADSEPFKYQTSMASKV